MKCIWVDCEWLWVDDQFVSRSHLLCPDRSLIGAHPLLSDFLASLPAHLAYAPSLTVSFLYIACTVVVSRGLRTLHGLHSPQHTWLHGSADIIPTCLHHLDKRRFLKSTHSAFALTGKVHVVETALPDKRFGIRMAEEIAVTRAVVDANFGQCDDGGVASVACGRHNRKHSCVSERH